ncbi:hypothetical protein ACPWT1_14670 [Ramlibacter sp. MMS24-I3-19]|uniref:hypothetical protein n=1 Tax=Ramlibacter sp. MMS24-I3-19 TaxID=3416606 RepID=UPI003D026837
MYLVVVAWLYVVLMMSVAEATSSNGTVLGALFTFALYGLVPIALLVYIMGTPGRKRAIKAREQAERDAQNAAAAASSAEPAGGREPAAEPVAAMRKEP